MFKKAIVSAVLALSLTGGAAHAAGGAGYVKDYDLDSLKERDVEDCVSMEVFLESVASEAEAFDTGTWSFLSTYSKAHFETFRLKKIFFVFNLN